MRCVAAVLALSFVVTACGKDSSPTGPGATTPPPTPSLYSLTGTVTSGGAPLAGASVTIMDSVNAGHGRTTDGSGSFSFTNLTPAVMTVQASAPGHDPLNRAVNLTSGNQVVTFALVKPNPFFIRAGIGDTVFDMPTYVRRVRIQGSTSSSCQNFIVWVGGRLIVNVIIGGCSIADSRTHDGTYLVSGGVTEIKSSSGVSWTFTEVR